MREKTGLDVAIFCGVEEAYQEQLLKESLDLNYKIIMEGECEIIHLDEDEENID